MAVSAIADKLGNLPDLAQTQGVEFVQASFNGLGALSATGTMRLNSGPFSSIPAPYFILFGVELSGNLPANSVLFDGVNSSSGGLTISLTSTNTTSSWLANGVRFANVFPGKMFFGILINGTSSEIWVDGVKTGAGFNFGSNPLTSIKFLNNVTNSAPFTKSALPPMIYRGIPTDARIQKMFSLLMGATDTSAPGSAFSFIGRSNPLSTERLQGVAFHNNNYIVSDSWALYRMSRSGNTYTTTFSRDTRNDDPSGKRQINGLDIHNNFLWVGINNYNTEPRRGWIGQYRLDDFTLVKVHPVDNNWNEGGAWKDVGNGPEYWAIAWDANYVTRYSYNGSDFTKIAEYNLPLAENRDEALYQAAQWYNDLLILPTHTNNGTPMIHFHRWTGSGFVAVKSSFPFTYNLGQGLYWEVPGQTMVFASRTQGTGPQTLVRANYIGI